MQESHQLLRDGLAQLLEAEHDVSVVRAVATGDELLRACEETDPDVVILELDEHDWDTASVVRRLRRRHPAARLVGLHAGPRPAVTETAVDVHASVSRHTGWSSVLHAVRVALGEVAPRPAPRSAPLAGPLTARELEVLEMVAAGWKSKEISERLQISPKTVENHKRRIFGKLGVQNQAHAVSVALQMGLLGGEAPDETP